MTTTRPKQQQQQQQRPHDTINGKPKETQSNSKQWTKIAVLLLKNCRFAVSDYDDYDENNNNEQASQYNNINNNNNNKQ